MVSTYSLGSVQTKVECWVLQSHLTLGTCSWETQFINRIRWSLLFKNSITHEATEGCSMNRSQRAVRIRRCNFKVWIYISGKMSGQCSTVKKQVISRCGIPGISKLLPTVAKNTLHILLSRTKIIHRHQYGFQNTRNSKSYNSHQEGSQTTSSVIKVTNLKYYNAERRCAFVSGSTHARKLGIRKQQYYENSKVGGGLRAYAEIRLLGTA